MSGFWVEVLLVCLKWALFLWIVEIDHLIAGLVLVGITYLQTSITQGAKKSP